MKGGLGKISVPFRDRCAGPLVREANGIVLQFEGDVVGVGLKLLSQCLSCACSSAACAASAGFVATTNASLLSMVSDPVSWSATVSNGTTALTSAVSWAIRGSTPPPGSGGSWLEMVCSAASEPKTSRCNCCTSSTCRLTSLRFKYAAGGWRHRERVHRSASRK